MKHVLANIIVNPINTLESCGKFEGRRLLHNKVTQKGVGCTGTDDGASNYSSVGDSKAQQMQQNSDTALRKLNRRNRYGKVSQCYVCKSKYHSSRTCP